MSKATSLNGSESEFEFIETPKAATPVLQEAQECGVRTTKVIAGLMMPNPHCARSSSAHLPRIVCGASARRMSRSLPVERPRRRYAVAGLTSAEPAHRLWVQELEKKKCTGLTFSHEISTHP